ncbi:MAG: hypothetical protein ACKO96_11995, partial [Flammeovirgaceae bacterium]
NLTVSRVVVKQPKRKCWMKCAYMRDVQRFGRCLNPLIGMVHLSFGVVAFWDHIFEQHPHAYLSKGKTA